jgi:hypothetical protein
MEKLGVPYLRLLDELIMLTPTRSKLKRPRGSLLH